MTDQHFEPCKWCGLPVTEQTERPVDYCSHDDLAAQLTEARKDTARLNYIERHPLITEIRTPEGAELGHAYIVAGHPTLKLREVLDVLIKQETNDGIQET